MALIRILVTTNLLSHKAFYLFIIMVIKILITYLKVEINLSRNLLQNFPIFRKIISFLSLQLRRFQKNFPCEIVGIWEYVVRKGVLLIFSEIGQRED